jgi:superfamily II DNA/RNA helicase
MGIHPLAVVNAVVTQYREHLTTEFRARDEALNAALQEALDRPGFLAQEPFFQAYRPFKTAKKWSELGLHPRLAEAIGARAKSPSSFAHQSLAVEHLLGTEGQPLVVTTGTGSGKSECFLIPALENAIRDSESFSKSGLTALLVYPMNALANDQQERIEQYLKDSGHTAVRVARYDRSTSEEERAALRKNPPHLLLTNYVMLEYLLVRPADRDDLFANHRCRFVVLDEVHTYRGALGANLALLMRRLQTHLRSARQDWNDAPSPARFPKLALVGTSATIKSVQEAQLSQEQLRTERDKAVQAFFATLTGCEAQAVTVLGEEYGELVAPTNRRWPTSPDPKDPFVSWMLNSLLAQRPRSLSQVALAVRDAVPERRNAALEDLQREVLAALESAAQPGTSNGLALRAHRFIRGGWHFHRCVKPTCGRLFPMGEEQCDTCGSSTAPLRLCRSCGVDVLCFTSVGEDPTALPLKPGDGARADARWYLYRSDSAELLELGETPEEMKGRAVHSGSFEPGSLLFSSDASLHPVRATLAPETNICLSCGANAGSGTILTRVALGTSAAVRVIAEALVEELAAQHRAATSTPRDPKERLLIFSDSRQDAAHQARFINYAGRYDRMRRRLLALLDDGEPRSIKASVEHLFKTGLRHQDNPQLEAYGPTKLVPTQVRSRAEAWEEAPLLDDLAVSPNYRATPFNLGLVGVEYEGLHGHAHSPTGLALAASLGVTPAALEWVARSVLDDMRMKRALSRPMLQYHPRGSSCPEPFRTEVNDWERRVPYPLGFSTDGRKPLGALDSAQVPEGIDVVNFWGDPTRGSRTRLRRRFVRLVRALAPGREPKEADLLSLLEWLMPTWVKAETLHGWRKDHQLLQVNADAVLLRKLREGERFRCTVCNTRRGWGWAGAPCPECGNPMRSLPEVELARNRYVRRLRDSLDMNLLAREHTAQVTSDDRLRIEAEFKAALDASPVNVLSCSPTLEMGVDVGGLDAVVMRNVPPRADNYAQRGGRAGRRTRVGVVLGFARNRPHDQYFYEHPEEMISGEVPAPVINLANRDVVVRHLVAINLGLAEPGLAGRMREYVTESGELEQANIDTFLTALSAKRDAAIRMAQEAWEPILSGLGLDSPQALSAVLDERYARIRRCFDDVAFQVKQLSTNAKNAVTTAQNEYVVVDSLRLIRRLLGMPEAKKNAREADDRGSGHPMRRLAEAGVLPGYEFPSEPATLRLQGDQHEDETITVNRRFGLAQYQPEATAYARGHRWEVVGLDTTSPWNPRSDHAQWPYTKCAGCELRYAAQSPKCPRCGTIGKDGAKEGWEFAGFLARRADTPVLEEEERFALASLLRTYPQHNGQVVGRAALPTGWAATLSQAEEIRWVNEWKPPSENEKKAGAYLHENARGFYLCPSCGRLLKVVTEKKKAQQKPRKGADGDAYGHWPKCPRAGTPPVPRAITTSLAAMTLRLSVEVQAGLDDADYLTWGHSLGASLRRGLRSVYALDGSEVEYELEPLYEATHDGIKVKRGSLLFIDGAVGGSGFLQRALGEFHLVARAAQEFLRHDGCESSCYRCLKSYDNQRFHEYLSWPRIAGDLEVLAAEAPVVGVVDPDPARPWREAYAAGVGSPLEHKFLKLFDAHGVAVDKQVPVGPAERAISVADFVLRGQRVAIYVDGAAFHVGDRLRRDAIIRKRLAEGGWRVVTLRARDLGDPAAVVRLVHG